MILLAVHLIMTADVEQDDLLFGYHDSQGNAVTVGQSDGMAAGYFAGKLMQSEGRLERVLLQSLEDRCETGLQVRMFFEEFTCLPEELIRSGYAEHGLLSVKFECL
jgi:hypothetical protein